MLQTFQRSDTISRAGAALAFTAMLPIFGSFLKAQDSTTIGPLASANERSVSESSRSRSVMAMAILAAHNQVRSEVGVRPLRWSDDLAAYAQEWADWLLEHNAFQHHSAAQRRVHHFGENLFQVEGTTATPMEVVTAWANEYVNYDYKRNFCREVCGHYTQMVWRDTKEVGCAVAGAPRGDIQKEVWVCEYDPPGNYLGMKPY